MGMKFDLKGVDELIKKLQRTQKEMVEKEAPKALAKAARVIRDEAKRRAALVDDPKSPENIAKNIVVRKARKKDTKHDEIKYKIGVAGGAKPDADGKMPAGGDTWYWRFIEFGTVKMAANPFLRPAMTAKQQEAAAVFISSFKEELDKIVK